MNIPRLIRQTADVNYSTYVLLHTLNSIQGRLEHYEEYPDSDIEYFKRTLQDDIKDIEQHLADLHKWYNNFQDGIR